MSEIWTAKEKVEQDGKPTIVFEVKDEDTDEIREEKRYKDALPLMFSQGGYPLSIGVILQMQELPWRFRKVGEHIYLDGPSMGIPGYHPIEED